MEINSTFLNAFLRSNIGIQRVSANTVMLIIRKVFGVILIAIAIKIFKTRLL